MPLVVKSMARNPDVHWLRITDEPCAGCNAASDAGPLLRRSAEAQRRPGGGPVRPVLLGLPAPRAGDGHPSVERPSWRGGSQLLAFLNALRDSDIDFLAQSKTAADRIGS
jgi:hypothetical protein